MAIVSIAPAGAVGLVTDVQPAETPPAAWTEVSNARFTVGEVTPMWSDLPLLTTPSFQGYYALPAPKPLNEPALWLVLGTAKAYAFTEDAITDVTRASGGDYTGQDTDRWNGGVLGGVVVANNGKDVPQAWVSPATANKLVDLANWPANTKAACLRSFKQFLIALDITKSTTRYPTMVKWSHPADPGTVPVSWNEADTTKDAGEATLSETGGAVVDSVPLKDLNIIYKSDSVWGMQYVGGAYIFRFYKIFGDWGMPIRDCAVEFLSGRHFVFTGADLVVHDGNSVKSVISGKVRKLIRAIKTSQLASCYVTVNVEMEEVWFCWRAESDGLTQATRAIAYNWVEETISMREIPSCSYIAVGRIDPPPLAGSTWGTNTEQWQSVLGWWGTSSASIATPRQMGVGVLELLWLEAGVNPVKEVKLVREQLGVAFRDNQPPDVTSRKFLQRIWPRITGSTGDIVKITLGKSEGVGFPTVWGPTKSYIIGTTKKLDYTLNGRLFSVKLESDSTRPWHYAGISADVVKAGNE